MHATQIDSSPWRFSPPSFALSLRCLFGFNPAWEYYGWDAYFLGDIKLRLVLPWMLMGLVTEILIAPTLPIVQLMEPYYLAFIAIASAITWRFVDRKHYLTRSSASRNPH